MRLDPTESHSVNDVVIRHPCANIWTIKMHLVPKRQPLPIPNALTGAFLRDKIASGVMFATFLISWNLSSA